jgi:hypothetical protein
MARMSSLPGDGRPRTVDRSALPDPALFAKPRDPNRGALRRIGLVAAALVATATFSALALPTLLARVRSAQSTTGIDALLATPGAAEGHPVPEERKVSPEEMADLQKSWVGSHSYAPRSDRIDPQTGERVAAFEGFGLTIDTQPPGASIHVNGEDKGTSPLLTTVNCAPGDEVRVEARRGRLRGRAVTRCRADQLARLRMTLR